MWDNRVKQPTDYRYSTKGISALLRYDKMFASRTNRAIDATTQEVVNKVKETIDDYVPYRTGRLVASMYDKKTKYDHQIIWDTKYASYVYNRKVTTSNIQGKRGPHWIERWQADYKTQVEKAAYEAFKRNI